MSRRSIASPIPSATGPARSGMPSSGPTRPATSRSRRRRRRRLLFAYLAVVALLFGTVIAAFTGHADPDTAAAPPTTSAPAISTTPSTSAAAGPDCSMPAGDQNSGEGVIAAFEHAYYVQRSGEAAHALVSPTAPSSAPFTIVANLDAGIATVAEGTTYCLDVDSLRPGVFTLALTESSPGGPGAQYRQRITTTEVDGRYVIASIDQA